MKCIKRLLLATLMTLIGLGAWVGPTPATAAEGGDEVLLYLAEGRLVVLKFQVLVDGQPYRDAWKTFLDEWFQRLDQNGDGELAGVERAALPSGRLLVLMSMGSRTIGETLRPAPATMKRAAFEEYLEQIGIRGFRMDIPSPQGPSTEYLGIRGMQQDPDQAAKLLFGHLDADADGKLSREEMENAPAALRKQDLDQDETISSAELIPVNFPYYAAVRPRSGPTPQDQAAFLSLSDGTSPVQTASRLIARYDTKEKDSTLSREELGMTEALFAGHDVDGNGRWDFEEIRQFLRAPAADVTVTVRFGQRAEGEPLIAFVHDESLTSQVQNAIGSLNLGTVQMEVAARREWTQNPDEMLKRRIKAADGDNNGYVDQPESRRLGMPPQLFSELDRDRDDKLFPGELTAALGPIMESAARQVGVTITDGGRDMFRILDFTGDGRLSVRELRAMADRAELWDRDDDGRITLAEIPQQYRLGATWGRDALAGFAPRVFVVSVGVGGPTSVPRAATGPRWFQRMDRNGDGDLSRREFLGTPDDFQKLDRDADGLIAADEAAHAPVAQAARSVENKGAQSKSAR